jgi:hypothetical protein
LQFLAVLLVLGFLAGAIRLLGYPNDGRDRLRLFLAAWFLGLSVLFLRAAWVSFTIEGSFTAHWNCQGPWKDAYAVNDMGR